LPFDYEQDEVVFPDGSVQPALRGPNSILDAMQRGIRLSGTTLHRVTSRPDRGEVMARALMHLPQLCELKAHNGLLGPEHTATIFRSLEDALVDGLETWLIESWPYLPQAVRT
jgi:hypothetical protein